MEGQVILVTGAAGFIGSHFCEMALEKHFKVIGIDNFTYAGSRENLERLEAQKNFFFFKVDIGQSEEVYKLLQEFSVDYLINFAAETHVDNSIQNPLPFLQSNVSGSVSLLMAADRFKSKKHIRYVQISTDEVYGELGARDFFSETNSYLPNSPYSASKASADHFVNAWHRTYGLDTVITNCSNNFGPFQGVEKLIPKTIYNSLKGLPIPVYGAGKNIRDWIYVTKHCQGIFLAMTLGRKGESYCFGGENEFTNLDIVRSICGFVDKLSGSTNRHDLIQFVADRPGHDFRYAIDHSKAKKELSFDPEKNRFLLNLEQTVKWYCENLSWMENSFLRTQKK